MPIDVPKENGIVGRDSVEHFFRRYARRAVKAPYAKPGDRVGLVTDFNQILCTRAQPVLGTEQNGELDFFPLVQEIDPMTELAIDGGRIRDEADRLARDTVDGASEELVEPGDNHIVYYPTQEALP